MKRIILGLITALTLIGVLAPSGCRSTGIAIGGSSGGGGTLVLQWQATAHGGHAWRTVAAAGTAGALAGLMAAGAIKKQVSGTRGSVTVSIPRSVNPKHPCNFSDWNSGKKIIAYFIPPGGEPKDRLMLPCYIYHSAATNGHTTFSEFINCAAAIIASGRPGRTLMRSWHYLYGGTAEAAVRAAPNGEMSFVWPGGTSDSWDWKQCAEKAG